MRRDKPGEMAKLVEEYYYYYFAPKNLLSQIPNTKSVLRGLHGHDMVRLTNSILVKYIDAMSRIKELQMENSKLKRGKL